MNATDPYGYISPESYMTAADIATSEPFRSLFPISRAVQIRIELDMQRNGFDPAMPIVLWHEGACVIDGHTRLAAAMAEGIADVPVVEKSFATEDAAVLYAIHCQKNRRNLSDADILRWVQEADKRKTKAEAGRLGAEVTNQQPPSGGCRTTDLPGPVISRVRKPESGPTPKEYSAAVTAAIVGTSPRKVERARTVLDSDNEGIKAQVMAGTLSINAASELVGKARREQPAMPSHIANAKPVKAKYDAGDAYAKLASELKKLAGDLPDARPEHSHGARTRVLFALTDLDKAVKSIRRNLTT